MESPDPDRNRDLDSGTAPDASPRLQVHVEDNNQDIRDHQPDKRDEKEIEIEMEDEVEVEDEVEDEEDIFFGKSVFKGKTGWKIETYRWFVQLVALLRKNVLILSRRPYQVSFFVSLPSMILFTFLLKENDIEYCGEPGLNLGTLGTVLPYVSTSVFLIMSFFSFSIVGEERYKHLFSYLRRLGLYDSAYWCSWFLVFQVLIIASCVVSLPVMAIVRTSSDALSRINYGMIYLIFWASASGMISNGFFLATICKSQQSSSTYTLLNLLLALLVVIICTSMGALNSYTGAQGFCYFESSSFNKVYSVGGSDLVQFIVWFMPWFHSAQALSNVVSLVQIKSIDVDALLTDFNGPNAHVLVTNKLFDGTSFFDTKWIGYSLWMLLTNAFVYVFLAWLAGLLLSTDETEGRSLTSIFLPLFIRKYFTKVDEDAVLHGDVRQGEQMLSEKERSVRAYKVSKTFKETQALKEVSFDLQRGSVFVLLGHNGAGKSTLINIITGLLKPTHGKVFISGLDVEVDASSVQQITGVCPQHDLLWTDLTAREHIYLTAAFKGIEAGKPLELAVKKMLTKMNLYDRADSCVSDFSGGMQRRLSVAMSAVGEIEIIFLDEPSTGLDPISRRMIWDAIHWMKKTRVVVLTTHNMDEADYLGDDIMVMHHGRVRAHGDPMFLKRIYGKGYQVNMISDFSQTERINQVVTSVLPGAVVAVDEVTGCVTITIGQTDVLRLPKLFAWLERSKLAARVVREWSISNTTLEQVFLRLCVQNEEVNEGFSNIDDILLQEEDRLCPMCRVNIKGPVLLKTLAGNHIIVPNSVCVECTKNNQHYIVSDDDVAMAGECDDMLQLNTILTKAQKRANTASCEEALQLENDDETSDSEQEVESTSLLAATSSTESSGRPATEFDLQRNVNTQIYALCHKNVKLQSYNRCSNICSIIGLSIFLLLLYLLGILASTPDDDEENQGLSSFLSIFLATVINIFWPMSVWRSSYEFSNDIWLMMRTSGIDPFTYLLGMCLYDMVISGTLGIVVVVSAFAADLVLFNDPFVVSYLVLAVILCVFSLSGFAMFIAKICPKNAALVTVMSVAMSLMSTFAAFLLTIILYTDNREWLWYLNWHPFFAQYRAFYIILGYQRHSTEIDSALSLLFVTGCLFFLCVYLIEMEMSYERLFQQVLEFFSTALIRLRHVLGSSGDTLNEELLAKAHYLDSMAEGLSDGSVTMDDNPDVDVERKHATTYTTTWLQKMKNNRVRYNSDCGIDMVRPSGDVEQSMKENSLDDACFDNYALVTAQTKHFYQLDKSKLVGRHADEGGIWALRDLSIALEYGECFGLLGPNGAGKSTLISILSGILKSTSGFQFIGGQSLQSLDSNIHTVVGFCPQFDVVWDNLSVEDHLTFQAKQRGIPGHLIVAEVQRVAISVGLDGDSFQASASKLSGGMRRRLSIGMSIVGNPKILFLDEPTTGLDPKNRQHVWKIIQGLKRPDRMILITTHSMQEAETLCSRIGIVAQGLLKCIGTSNHLKEQYGRGYTLTVTIIPCEEGPKSLQEKQRRADISNFICNIIAGGSGELINEINQTRKYLIPKECTTISDVFYQMENNKSFYFIREWGLGMVTLEEVFIAAVGNSL